MTAMIDCTDIVEALLAAWRRHLRDKKELMAKAVVSVMGEADTHRQPAGAASSSSLFLSPPNFKK
jgi:hypothetical protein